MLTCHIRFPLIAAQLESRIGSEKGDPSLVDGQVQESVVETRSLVVGCLVSVARRSSSIHSGPAGVRLRQRNAERYNRWRLCRRAKREKNEIPGLKAKSISFAFRQMAFEGSGS